jgi:hypothetical protein
MVISFIILNYPYIDIDVIDMKEMCKIPQLNAAVLVDLNRLAAENKLSGLEKIK